MSKIRILYVASEIDPFLQTSEVADFVRKLPQAMQERGMEIRILVPRFGLINERKNRLHEVVRLSGINIAVRELGWGPDIVHCNDWITSFIPLYLKTTYKNDPLFKNSKTVFTIYNNGF